MKTHLIQISLVVFAGVGVIFSGTSNATEVSLSSVDESTSISGADAANQELEAAIALVRSVHYEGLSYAAGSTLSPEAIDHIAALLDDPGEALWHSNILIAIGMAGHPGSYETLVDHGLDRSGEVSRDEYRARLAQITAMGHLSRRDERALAWLEEAVLRPAAEPGFSFGVMRGERLANQLLARAVASLALSGSDEAVDLLHSLRAASTRRTVRPSVGLSPASIDAALEGLERMQRDGPDAALASPFGESHDKEAAP